MPLIQLLKLFIVGFLLSGFDVSSVADTIEVQSNQPNAAGTIQAAIDQSRPGDIVLLKSGLHRIREPLVFTNRERLVLQGEKNTRLVLSKNVGSEHWKPIGKTDDRSRFPLEAVDHIYELDLKEVSIEHSNRLPDHFSNRDGFLDIISQGKRLQLARWPNDEPTTMGTVLDHAGGVFEYRNARHEQWPVNEGVWLQGYWRVPWQLHGIRVKTIDPKQHSVELSVEIAGGIGSKYHRPGGSGEEPYWVINQPGELDRPGEWYQDFANGRLFLWPTAELQDIEIVDETRPAISIVESTEVNIEGLSLSGGLGQAIKIEGGHDCQVRNCQIKNFADWGVVVKGGVGHAVRDCEMSELGGGGISLDGGDRLTLKSANHVADSNHIHHFGHFQRTYSSGVKLGDPHNMIGLCETVGCTVSKNEIHDAPHAGILYGGCENVLEHNSIHAVCQVSNDMGGFYTWHDWTSYGNIVRFNHVYDSPQAHGIYLDDADSGDLVHTNRLEGLAIGILIGGGHDNTVRDNTIRHCQTAISIDARGISRNYTAENDRLKKQISSVADQPLWEKRYPSLSKRLENHPELPRGNRIEGNQWSDCEQGVVKVGLESNFEFNVFKNNPEE